MQLTCKDCKYWNPSDHVSMPGECRHESPIADVEHNSCMWPPTGHDMWCGDIYGLIWDDSDRAELIRRYEVLQLDCKYKPIIQEEEVPF